MKYYDYIRKRILRDKSNIFIVLLFAICSFILLIAFAYKDTAIYEMNMTFKNAISARSLLVSPSRDYLDKLSSDERRDFEYDIDAIKKIDHVIGVNVNSGGIPVDSDFANSNVDGRISLNYATKDMVKDLTGKSLFGEEDYGVAICPKKFYPGSYSYDDLELTKFYDQELVGHTFNITYDIKKIDENGEIYVESQESKSFKVVGLYDSELVQEHFSTCYIGGDEFDEIYEDWMGEVNKYETGISSIKVILDNHENADYVANELKKLGLKGTLVLSYDGARVTNAILINIMVAALLTVFIIFLSELYIKKKLIKNMGAIRLLYSLGIPNKDIENINLIYIMSLLVISFIIGIIGFIIMVILNTYTSINLRTISIISFIICLSVMLLIPLLIYKYLIHQLLGSNKKN